ncbi:transcriptional regulator, IclR family, C-terminal domain protein [Bifidobacterium longum subsp. longum ATCC 55813]|nr:transcriptional regulator, IclR family, C-terminal domain protein [Bifidobacterium longum subsp. longum ATCC 55813]
MSAPSHVLTAWLPPARYEQLLEHYAYNNELGGTFSTMRTTAMGQARHIRECGFTYDVGQTMAGSVTISVPVFNHAGEIQAAIALSGLSRSLEPELACLVDGKPATASAQDMVQLVQTAGREVSRGLGYSGDYLGLSS